MSAPPAPAGSRWAPAWVVAAVAAGVGWEAWLLGHLDVSDLPGPGGALLARDLWLGQVQQGPAAWAGHALTALGLGPAAAARAVCFGGFAAALAGAGLAAGALSGWSAGAWAALLCAAWGLAAAQGWLLDPGGLAWGLAWLGVGLAWAGAARGRALPAALGAALLVFGVAVKASALPVAPMLAAGPLLAPPGARRRVGIALAVGAAVALLPAWAAQSPDQPWLPRGDGAPRSGPAWLGAVLALPGRGLRHGAFPALFGLAAVGTAAGARRRSLRLALLAFGLLAFALTGHARGERLQPRHLLPASLALVVLAASPAGLRRGRRLAWAGLGGACALGLLDTVAYADAWAAQRAAHAGTAPARLPGAPEVFERRHAALPWVVFAESSLAGAAALPEVVAGARHGLAGPPLQDRREAQLEVLAAEAGMPWRTVARDPCCRAAEDLAGCAARVLDDVERSGFLLVLPGKALAAERGEQAWVGALLAEVQARRPAPQRRRWITWRGPGGSGAGPCAPPPAAR